MLTQPAQVQLIISGYIAILFLKGLPVGTCVGTAGGFAGICVGFAATRNCRLSFSSRLGSFPFCCPTTRAATATTTAGWINSP